MTLSGPRAAKEKGGQLGRHRAVYPPPSYFASSIWRL
jgi:hypothetical protein